MHLRARKEQFPMLLEGIEDLQVTQKTGANQSVNGSDDGARDIGPREIREDLLKVLAAKCGAARFDHLDGADDFQIVHRRRHRDIVPLARLAVLVFAHLALRADSDDGDYAPTWLAF